MSDDKPQEAIKHGSVEHALLLKTSYRMTQEDAKDVVKQRKLDFKSVPFELYETARNMLAELTNKPVVTASLEMPLSHAS